MQQRINLCLVYLGRKGGGSRLALYLIEEIKRSATIHLISSLVSEQNVETPSFLEEGSVLIKNIGFSGESVDCLISPLFSAKKINKLFKVGSGDICLIVMSSPRDYLITWRLRRSGVKIIRIIHDFNRHPGDIWPRDHQIRKLILRSDYVITLSQHIQRKISSAFPSIPTVSVSLPAIIRESQIKPPEVLPSQYILFIGRIREYKGVPALLAAHNLGISSHGLPLVIAGEGSEKFQDQDNVTFINRWLSDSEILWLISNSDLIVFPYIEASQSGLIPIAIRLNKKIVVSNLEGLLEQCKTYANAIILDNLDSKYLAEKIQCAISQAVIGPEIKAENSDFIFAICNLLTN